MALIFADGFDQYSQTSDLSRNWPNGLGGWTWANNIGRAGGGGITSSGSVSSVIYGPNIFNTAATTHYNFAFNYGPYGICFWAKLSATPSADMILVGVANGAFGALYWLSLHTDGKLFIQDSSGPGYPGRGSTALNVCDNTWHWFEWYLYGFNNGTQKIYVDNVAIWNSTVSINNNGNVDRLFFSQNNSCTVTIDDVFVVDQFTPSPNVNDIPFGPRVITTLKPSGDSSVQFAPDTGATNYTQVNEVAADDDTHYVQANTIGNTDSYNYDDLPYTPAAVTAVQVVSRLKNPGVGTFRGRSKVTSGSASVFGPNTVLGNSYQNIRECHSLDPSTAAAWTPTTVNAMKAGIEAASASVLTWNPNDANPAFTFSNGNLTASCASQTANYMGVRGNIGYAQGGSQKVYLEFNCAGLGGNQNFGAVGLAREDSQLTGNFNSTNSVYIRHDGSLFNNGTQTSGYIGPSTAVVGVALDVAHQTAWFRLNDGVWYGSAAASGNPATNTGGIDISAWFTAGHTIYPLFAANTQGAPVSINGGALTFYNPIPSGFTPWDLLS